MSAVLSATNVKNKTHTPTPVALRYGMLSVIKHVSKKGWLCKCDCGNEKYVDGNHLRNFKYLSCGCDSKKRQARSLLTTLQVKKKAKVVTAVKPIKHATTGTPCWVCRNKTGTTEVIALCKRCITGEQEPTADQMARRAISGDKKRSPQHRPRKAAGGVHDGLRVSHT